MLGKVDKNSSCFGVLHEVLGLKSEGVEEKGNEIFSFGSLYEVRWLI